MMVRRFYRPHAPLAAFVPRLLLCATGRRPLLRERLLPTATTELVFDLSHTATRRFDAKVCGPHSTFFEIERPANSVILSAHFPPGCAFPFFGVPMNELHNSVVPLRALWGRGADELHERLLAASLVDRLVILERWLLARATATRRHPSVTAARSGYSDQAHLNHDFRAFCGLTPNAYLRYRGPHRNHIALPA